MGGTLDAAGSDGPTVANGHGPGKYFDVSVAPLAGETIPTLQYSLYLPDGVNNIRAVIVHQHGCTITSGLTASHDLHWQALANKWGFGLIGTLYPGDCAKWRDPTSGSGRAFIAALAALAGKSNHPELADAKWVIWGHSGGATWAYRMTRTYPDRILATVARSICFGADTKPNPQALAVPVMVITANADIADCLPTTRGTFGAYRAAGAPWTFVNEPYGTHDCLHSRYLAIPYLDQMISERLPAAGATLAPVPAGGRWLGDTTAGSAVAEADYVGDKTKASWLPDRRIAGMWQEFMKTANVTDTTPPTEAPTDLVATVSGSSVNLRWSAAADLEGGIRSFNYYRDGAKIGAFNGSFQTGSFTDDPNPSNPAMTSTDTGAGQGMKHSYEVTTVNWSNLESPHSLPSN